MKKKSKKKLLILPFFAIICVLICLFSVKNDTFTTISQSIKAFFETTEKELTEDEAAKESGFNDTNLYKSVIDEYNKLTLTNNKELSSDTHYGTISYLGGFSSNIEVQNNEVTFNNGTVTYYDTDTSVGRNQPGNRVGLKITAPESLTYEDYKNASIVRIQYYSDHQDMKVMKFSNIKDSDTYYETWPVVKPNLTKIEIYINWTGTSIQKFTINFGENLTLENYNDEVTNEELTPSYGTIEYLGGFSNTPSIENNEVTFENGTVTYYDADTSVGRNQPGNRVGLKITAPESLTYEDYKNANIVRVETYNDKKEIKVMKFSDVKDTDTYYETWPLVYNNLTKTEIYIDWNGTNIQKFTINYDNSIKLERNPQTLLSYNSIITKEQMSLIENLNSSNLNIEDLTGIEQLTNLKTLDLSNNNLTNVDLSSLSNLTSINLLNNNFQKDVVLYEGTSLDTSKYPKPTILPEHLSIIEKENQDNTYIFGTELENIYEITYNIEEYTYKNNNYLNFEDTFYTINNEFEDLSSTLDNGLILTQENDKLTIKDAENNELKVFNLIKIDIESTKFPKLNEIPDSLYTGLNPITKEDITSNADISIEDNKIIIKHNNHILKEINIITSTITSDKYNLNNPYIYTGFEEFDISNINFVNLFYTYENNELKLYENEDKTNELLSYDIITLSLSENTNIEKIQNKLIITGQKDFNKDDLITNKSSITINEDNTISILYNEQEIDKFYIIKELKNNYILKDNAIYTKINEKLSLDNIKYSNSEISRVDNTLNITSNNEIIYSYKIIEPSYTISKYPNTNSYIYVKDDSNETIKDSIVSNDINITINDNELLLTTNIEELSIPIYRLSSNLYNLHEEYIFTGKNEFINDFTSNQENIIIYNEDTSTIEIKIDNTILDTYKIVSINTNYIIEDNIIYPGINPLNLKDISTTNSTSKIDNQDLVITYGTKEQRYSIKYTTVTSTKYDLPLSYIYTGFDSLDESSIIVENGSLSIENNELVIYDKNHTNILLKKDIITLSISNNNIKLYNNTLYIEDYELNDSNMQSNITSTNSLLKIENGYLKILKNGEYLDNISFPIVTLNYKGKEPDYIFIIGNKSIKDNCSISYPKEIENSITIKEDNNLTVSINNIDVFTKKIVRLTHPTYDITDTYIFTGTEEFTNENFIKNEDITIEKQSNKVKISYENTIITLDLKNISSSKYDLTNNYIELGQNNFNISDITFDPSIVKYEEDKTNNNIKFTYKDKEYIYHLVKVTTPYIIKDNKIYTKFNQKFNEKDYNITNGKVTKEGNYLIVSIDSKTTKYEIIEPSYDLSSYPNTKDYIYVGTDTEASLVKVNNAKYIVNNNTLEITSNSGETHTIPLYYISSNKYNLTKKYIYTKTNKLDEKDIITSHDNMTSISNDKLNIIINNNIVDTYELISISSQNNQYDLNKDNIYTGFNNFDINNIIVKNATKEFKNNELIIKKNNEVLSKYKVVKSTMSNKNPNYIIKDNYIFTSTHTFNKDDITLVNATSKVINNELIISNEEGIISSYDIVTIKKSPDFSKGYIYTEYNKLNINDIELTNGTKEISNNHLIIKYNNDILLNIPIVTITTNIDLSNNYVYTKFINFDIRNVNISNGTKEIINNELILKYGNTVLKAIDLPKISLNNIDIKANNIIIKEKTEYKDFIKNVNCTKSTCEIVKDNNQVTSGTLENNMYLIVKYNNNEIDKFKFIVDYLEIPNIKTDENNHFITSFKVNSKVSDIKNNILTSGEVTILDHDNKVLEDNAKLATGYKVIIKLNNTTIEYTIVIKGDVLGNGEVGIHDVGMLYQNIRGRKKLDKCYLAAGDVTGKKDGVNVHDVGYLYQYIRGRIKSLEE